jgi:hypothetical protein
VVDEQDSLQTRHRAARFLLHHLCQLVSTGFRAGEGSSHFEDSMPDPLVYTGRNVESFLVVRKGCTDTQHGEEEVRGESPVGQGGSVDDRIQRSEMPETRAVRQSSIDQLQESNIHKVQLEIELHSL